jgi:hypothetical protein
MAGKPGRSGRKGHGPKPKVYFNSRMDPALRDKLQAAAKAGGQTLSAEIEMRLKNSFAFAKEQDPQVRAVSYLTGQLAHLIGPERKTNRWVFEAYLTAVALLIQKLQPQGNASRPDWADKVLNNHLRQVALPPEQLEKTKTPALLGDIAVISLWGAMLVATDDLPADVKTEDGNWSYSLSKARRDLGIPMQGPGLDLHTFTGGDPGILVALSELFAQVEDKS